MFKQMFDMPPGTIGFEAVGDRRRRLRGRLAPVFRRQIAGGHKLSLMYLLGTQLRENDGDAAQEAVSSQPATPPHTGASVS